MKCCSPIKGLSESGYAAQQNEDMIHAMTSVQEKNLPRIILEISTDHVDFHHEFIAEDVKT